MITTIGRRSFLTALGIAAASSLLRSRAARAQRLFKIGMLYTGGVDTAFTAAFMRKLGELGYAEGKNVVIARKSADGDIERLKAFAADLVAQQVDVIVTMGTPAGFAAKQSTGTIPIVLGANSDPVGVGLVASLARPGGNVTGVSLMAPELSAKRLDILRTLSPKISRFAILWIRRTPAWQHACMKPKSPPISRTCCCTSSARKILRSWRQRSPSFSRSARMRCW